MRPLDGLVGVVSIHATHVRRLTINDKKPNVLEAYMYRLQAAKKLVDLPSNVTRGMDEQQKQDFIMGALNMLHAKAFYDGSKQSQWILDMLMMYSKEVDIV